MVRVILPVAVVFGGEVLPAFVAHELKLVPFGDCHICGKACNQVLPYPISSVVQHLVDGVVVHGQVVACDTGVEPLATFWTTFRTFPIIMRSFLIQIP